MAGIPVYQSPVLEGQFFSRPWYLALQTLATPPYQKSAGITGAASVSVPNGPTVYYLNLTGNVTSLAVTFPSAPSDAQELTLANISAAFTIAGITYPATVIGGATSLAVSGAGGFEKFKFSATDAKWYRIG